MSKKTRIFVVTFFCVVVALLLGAFVFVGKSKEETNVTIGVIMPGTTTEVGWNGTHYNGIKQACDSLGVKIMLKQNVKEYSGECAKVVEDFIRQGVKMFILVSYNYPDEIRQVIIDHPDVQFYCCASLLNFPNYKSYFARVYQARYLSGIIAGMHTKTNHVGYVAAMNNAEVNRGLNAFALGVRSVNPNAEVFATWTNSWDDAVKEKANVQLLADSANVDVVAYHQNQTNVIEKAEELGIYSIGYNEQVQKFSDKVLTSVITNWEMVYKEFIQDYLQQKNTDQFNYWIGIEDNAPALAFYSPLVTDSTKSLVESATQTMKNGRDVFYGEIIDNNGVKRAEANEVVGDEILRNSLDWFVAGVKFLN